MSKKVFPFDWKLGAGDADEIPKLKKGARKSFATMWLAGALGAYFGFIAVNAPLDLPHSWFNSDRPVELRYTLEVIVRYGYLLWFLAYFFISNYRHEGDEDVDRKEVGFNLVQSVLAFGAAYFLGFLTRDDASFPQPLERGVIASNVSILLICLSSLGFFGCVEAGAADKEGVARLNPLRILGALIAFATAALCILIDDLVAKHLWVVLISQALLVFAWLRFRKVRLLYK